MQQVVTLPRGGTGDPSRPSLDEALDVIAEESAVPPKERLLRMAAASGDISHVLDADYLTKIGSKCVDDYERDLKDRKEWEEVASAALDACAQEETDQLKDSPWPRASNMKWPLLTTACLQFNARMYPAVVKGDEAVLCKVVGQDNGRPLTAPNPQHGAIQPVPAMGPDGQPALDANGQPQPQWLVPPGAKAKRARRVGEYLNHQLFYRQENWEDDTDALLMQLPAIGCVFRKSWVDETGPKSATISALDLVVPSGARNLASSPRITEKLRDVYPHEIIGKIRSGYYREVGDQLTLTAENTDDDGARLLLEQQCLWDLDEDGLAEPYIVTLDHETRTVLRIEPNFSPRDVRWIEDKAVSIGRRTFYVMYGMFPHPKGRFYPIGLGHLLKRLGDVIDTSINQLLDAGHAQTAGGGFIGSGVRLQSRGQRSVIRFAPGEYKTVDVSGDTLKNNIVERTLPNVSPVTYQVLDLILGAAREVAGVKDVITGEASNMGQVGTTLALIEQGLQVFNAAAKRVFRSLKAEYTLLFDNIAEFGGEAAAQDYVTVLDDPDADFEKDFDRNDLDIRPVSDPSAITRMQKMARAQFVLGLAPGLAQVGGDPREAYRRALEAVDAEDIDKLLPPPKAPDPQQLMAQAEQMVLALRGMAAKAEKDEAASEASKAKALKDSADAAEKRFDLTQKAGQHGMELGAMSGGLEATNAALGLTNGG